MAFQDVLAAESDRVRTSESGEHEPADQATGGDRDRDPFSMDYDLESFDVDAEATNQLLTMLVAATNLL